MMPSWKLENAVEIQNESPYTFYRPSDATIDRLRPGEAIVKLIFSFDSDEPDAPGGERMWVILDVINEDGTFRGTLDNDSYHIKDLVAGDKIHFTREHIIDYDTLNELDISDENVGKLDQYFKRCIVSNQIMNDNKPIGYIYREGPSEENDSGWHIMSGEEDDAYAEISTNFQYIAIGVVLNKDDSFVGLLNEPVGSEFGRDDVTKTFFPLH